VFARGAKFSGIETPNGPVAKAHRNARSIVAFFFHGGCRNNQSFQDELTFVLDDPLDGLSALELHGLGDGGGKVDEPLLGLLS
jgi:hypothetical protein